MITPKTINAYVYQRKNGPAGIERRHRDATTGESRSAITIALPAGFTDGPDHHEGELLIVNGDAEYLVDCDEGKRNKVIAISTAKEDDEMEENESRETVDIQVLSLAE